MKMKAVLDSRQHPALACILLSVFAFGSTSPAFDPVRDLTGRTLKQHVESKIEKAEISSKKFLHNPIDYLMQLPASIVADICSAPIQTYEETLRGKASGKWKSLPEKLIDAIQGAYSINLRQIRYAENIKTSNGHAQTFGGSIYFPRRIDLRNREDLFWMLHELEHSVQFAGAKYGESGKLCEYVLHAVGAGFDHDRISMERAADRKADWVIDYAHWVMTNQLPTGVKPNEKLKKNQILIFNETDDDVVFVMETKYTASGTERIPARSWVVFTGDKRDRWFNVEIGTDTPQGRQRIMYGLDGGTRQHIDFNSDEALDFFHE